MLSFITTVLFVGALVMAGIGICKAFSLISQHVQEHLEAGKAIFEHVFMPLFGSRKARPQQEETGPGPTGP